MQTIVINKTQVVRLLRLLRNVCVAMWKRPLVWLSVHCPLINMKFDTTHCQAVIEMRPLFQQYSATLPHSLSHEYTKQACTHWGIRDEYIHILLSFFHRSSSSIRVLFLRRFCVLIKSCSCNNLHENREKIYFLRFGAPHRACVSANVHAVHLCGGSVRLIHFHLWCDWISEHALQIAFSPASWSEFLLLGWRVSPSCVVWLRCNPELWLLCGSTANPDLTCITCEYHCWSVRECVRIDQIESAARTSQWTVEVNSCDYHIETVGAKSGSTATRSREPVTPSPQTCLERENGEYPRQVVCVCVCGGQCAWVSNAATVLSAII